jgi:putative phosphonate catabolism associated alcohol dehydrogenase
MIAESCKAAVFEKVGTPLDIREFPVPRDLEPGAALCRVRLSTVCGSDLHTTRGRRPEPTPLVLGHEIVGELVAIGSGLTKDGFGDPLKVGDRVSWTIMASCGKCFFCTNGLPQKCESLKKYGHTAHNDPHIRSGLVGGYAEYVYILPGTTLFRIPASLSDEVVTPANCALSTIENAVDTIGIRAGETVLVQGAGLLGLNAVALAREAGARLVFSTDVLDSRIDMAKRFGASRTFNMATTPFPQVKQALREATGGRGVDVAIEVSGVRDVAAQAADLLRIGGRYLIAGLVTPGSLIGIDGNQVTRKCLTIKGIHNYRPEHLGQAIRFLEQNAGKYPFAELVGATFPLSRINEALDASESGAYIRVGVKPD